MEARLALPPGSAKSAPLKVSRPENFKYKRRKSNRIKPIFYFELTKGFNFGQKTGCGKDEDQALLQL